MMVTKIIIACGISLALSASAVSLQLHSQMGPAFSPSASAGGDSYLPVISPDGRFVLFSSAANNLALTASNTPYRASLVCGLNVFLRDRASNTTVLVSVNLAGTGGADRDAIPAGISTNGQFALFESAADNLAAGATNSVHQVFVRDLLNGTNFLVSVNTNGLGGNGDSYNSVITPDGRWVAFTSAASDLVTGDSNGIPDVFVRDLANGVTRWVSVGAKSTNATYLSTSDEPVITPDGRYVAFYSSATNLVAGQRLAGDVYERDLVAGTTTWVSAQARSQFKALTGSTNVVSCTPCISDDGNYVAFLTCTNAPSSSSARGIVLRYHLAGGQTDLVNTNSYVPLLPFEQIEDLNLTPDGRFIAFVADVGNTTGTNTAIYLWDAQSGNSTLVSADTNNALATAFCDSPCVSSDGRYVVFLSTATSFATNAVGANQYIYQRDVVAGTTAVVNADTNGVQLPDNPMISLCLSASGQFVVFDSTQPGLATNDRNHDSDVFLRDVSAGTTELVSARQPSLPSCVADGRSTIAAQPLSQDGHYMVFANEADDLVAGDANQLSGVFERDLYQGTTVLVSVGLNGASASGVSYEPAVSGDGRYVAFTSAATNLVAGDTNNSLDVVVRDLQANTTALISVNAAGTGEGNADSYTPAISADGRFVLFLSLASNLAAGSYTKGAENLFLRDRQAGVTYALTTAGQAAYAMTPDGHYVAFTDKAGATAGSIYIWDSQLAQRVATISGPTYVQKLSVSPDGNRIAWFAGSSSCVLSVYDRTAKLTWPAASGASTPAVQTKLRFSGNGNCLTCCYAPASILPKTNQVYLCNVPSQTITLVSHGAGPAVLGDGSSDSPDISADGRFVVYRSAADNLVNGDTNGVPDIYLFDANTGGNVLLSAEANGGVAADNRSLTPIFSGDGRTLVFRSWASDLTTGDFNQSADVFAYVFLYATPSPAAGGGLTINWPMSPGQNFAVQYKDDLADPVWHNCSGTISTNGNRAWLTDPGSSSDHRFYRVQSDK